MQAIVFLSHALSARLPTRASCERRHCALRDPDSKTFPARTVAIAAGAFPLSFQLRKRSRRLRGSLDGSAALLHGPIRRGSFRGALGVSLLAQFCSARLSHAGG